MADPWSTDSGGEMLSSPTPSNDAVTSIAQQPQQPSGWMQLLQLLASNSGSNNTGKIPFAPLGLPQQTSQPGIPLYYMPQAAPSAEDDPQKQTSIGQAAEYAKILAQLFA